MYMIYSLEPSRGTATLVSESKAGIVPLRQHYIPQEEELYMTGVSCNLTIIAEFGCALSTFTVTD